MAQSPLTGRVALVTGGAGGIGSAISRRLAADGAQVVISYVSSPDDAAQVASQIRADGGQVDTQQADISKVTEIRRLFDAAERTYGPVDLLVNAAGLRTRTPAEEIEETELQTTFAVNVDGPVLCMVELARRLGRAPGSRGGRIVNLTSGQARTPPVNDALYAGSKAALESMTMAFAADLGPAGITVNAVAPGATATQTFLDGVPAEAQRQTIDSTALGRLGTPDDIAPVVAFLCSDDAGWVTGQVIDVSGGLRRS